MYDSNDLSRDIKLNKDIFLEMMYNRIDGLDIKKAVKEVKPFIKDRSGFDFWTKDYFKLLSEKFQFTG